MGAVARSCLIDEHWQGSVRFLNFVFGSESFEF